MNEAKLKMIKPGKTYPQSVTITEKAGTGLPFAGQTIRFFCQSYILGMYCAIHMNESRVPHQQVTGHNTTFTRKLKKDIAKAIERGATVEIGAIVPVAS